MTIKGGTNKACAACKYQRRRCSKECILSPYFPADQPKKFQNAHRLFGVCNMKRILKQVPPEQRDEAMDSIIFESDMRARYPVDGCLGVTRHYQYLVLKATEELHYVKMKLAFYKEEFSLSHQTPPFSFEMPSISELPIYNLSQYKNEEFPIVDGSGVYSDAAYIDSTENYNLTKPIVALPHSNEGISITNVSSNAMGAQPNLIAVGGLSNQQELDALVNYEDIPMDEWESSGESSFKVATQHIEHVSKNELKDAAAFFRLTTVK